MKRFYAVKTKDGYVSGFVMGEQMNTSNTLRGADFYKRSQALEIAYYLIKSYKDHDYAELEAV